MRTFPVAFMLMLACGGSEKNDVAGSPDSACSSGEVAEEVMVTNAFGALHGTLTLPAGCDPVPAVLIIAGSGPTDRDGNSGAALRTDTYRLLAEGLSARGVAALRYDKAGVGASGAAGPRREEDFLFTMGAEDAALFLSQLRAQARFSRVLIAGHSEGALLGMLAAERVPIDGYVSLAGGGRPIGAILREQLGRQLDATLLAQSEAIITQLEAGNTVDAPAVPPDLAALFRPSVQPYLISLMKYDPAQELAKLEAPALIVQGTTDIQVGVVDAELLAEARDDAELRLIEGMSHMLKAASLDNAEQQRAYTDPSLPVVPEVIDRIASLATQ